MIIFKDIILGVKKISAQYSLVLCQKNVYLLKIMVEPFTISHLRMMQNGIRLFNEGQFWECHEDLEDPWMECAHEPAKYVFWAIIQVATSLYHFENKNLIGATGMLNKAREKFKHCEPLEGPLLRDHLSWDTLKKLVEEIPLNPSLEDFSKLYLFKFKEIQI